MKMDEFPRFLNQYSQWVADLHRRTSAVAEMTRAAASVDAGAAEMWAWGNGPTDHRPGQPDQTPPTAPLDPAGPDTARSSEIVLRLVRSRDLLAPRHAAKLEPQHVPRVATPPLQQRTSYRHCHRPPPSNRHHARQRNINRAHGELTTPMTHDLRVYRRNGVSGSTALRGRRSHDDRHTGGCEPTRIRRRPGTLMSGS